MGVAKIPHVLRSFRIKSFIILTKYISLERSESQDSIFGIFFVTENAYKNSVEFGWHAVDICSITPKQNFIGTSILI